MVVAWLSVNQMPVAADHHVIAAACSGIALCAEREGNRRHSEREFLPQQLPDQRVSADDHDDFGRGNGPEDRNESCDLWVIVTQVSDTSK